MSKVHALQRCEVRDVQVVLLVRQVTIHVTPAHKIRVHQYSVLLVSCNKATPDIALVILNQAVGLFSFVDCALR